MLDKESAVGLLHSATTAKMSRDPITQALAAGQAPQITTQSIVDRFPAQVGIPTVTDKGDVMEVGPPGASVSLAVFHNDNVLGEICRTKIFPNKIPNIQKAAASTRDLSPALSKDERNLHAGQPF
jgi:hypothetical protein